ncbi:MAG: hypothetical protein IT440_11030, partial [Phycisphaeraceae bacterium]|nr:hypothetical protein [Phycisphaeraceae bacterium]
MKFAPPIDTSWSRLPLVLALLLVANPARPQSEDPERPVETVILEFIRAYPTADDLSTAHLYRRCDRDPAGAVRCFAPFARHADPLIRDLAIEALARYDRYTYLPETIAAGAQGSLRAFSILRNTDWSRAAAGLRTQARVVLCRQVEETANEQAASALGAIGLEEDIPALQTALDRVLSRRITLPPPRENLQRLLEASGTGIPPFEHWELDLRQAMARLGDTDQLRFFRHRLLGGDRTRAIDALDRSIYIARSELAEAVGTFLSDTTPLPGGGHGMDTPARWAIDTLAKTYPEIAKSCPRNNRAQFWRTQLDNLREDAAADGPTHDPRPGNIDRDPAPINTAPGNTGP